jgi:GAF domain-containing protein
LSPVDIKLSSSDTSKRRAGLGENGRLQQRRRANVTGVPNFHFLMRDLAHEVDAGRVTDIEAAGKVAESIQKTLQCMHVTFWSVSGQVGHRAMRSVAAYDGARDVAVAGTAVFPESGGGFFGALVRDGCYVCGDTFADPTLQSVKEIMLVPFNIRALLAASYGGDGEVWGIITCTNNVARKWRPFEVTALRRCAAEISTLRAQRRLLGNSLSTGGFLN